MAFLGKTLTVYLAADTAKLRSGLTQAETGLAGFGNKLPNMLGPALIGAAAAVGTLAVAMGIDAVQSAMAEEEELAKLNTTLENLGFASASDEINTFIDDMQFATGVSDSKLRPAYERILISVGDVTQAQKLLNLAVSTSVGTGKSLETVANALGKAYDGNFGALSKLNAGIDSSIIKNKDLDGAIQTLADTFGGQAAAKAATLSGQIDILKVAFDELKESAGKGFIDGLAKSSGSLDNLVQQMRDGQPVAEDFGYKIGILAGQLVDAALGFKKVYEESEKLFDNVFASVGPVGTALGDFVKGLLNLPGTVISGLADIGSADQANGGVRAFNTGGALGRLAAAAAASKAAAAAAAAAKAAAAEEERLRLLRLLGTVAIDKMDSSLRNQIDLVKSLTSRLDDAGKALVSARRDMNNWIDSMSKSILSGINLGAAFDQMDDVNDAGEKIGVSLLEGFQKQIDQAGIFGGYLKQLNSEGGPELRDAVAALGPEAGSKLAKEIIDKGLIATMQSKLVDVQHMAETTAAEMVPPMLVAGVASAASYLMTMQAELEESSTLLKEMGRAMGKTLSEAMVAEIRAALAAAGVAQGGTSEIMAGVPTPGIAQAQLIAGNPLLNGTAIMQAIQNAILQSDQRLGRTGQVLNA
jgi:hypothetical protein